MSAELWKPVLGFEGRYEVSSEGRVRSLPRTSGRGARHQGKFLSHGLAGRGYPFVQIGHGNTRYIHILMLEAFVGPRPAGMQGCHENDVPTDNRLDNLRWDTRKANAADALKNGRRARGEKQGSSRFTEVDVERMRDMRRCGATLSLIGAQFGLNSAGVSQIVSGRRWRYLPGASAPCG